MIPGYRPPAEKYFDHSNGDGTPWEAKTFGIYTAIESFQGLFGAK